MKRILFLVALVLILASGCSGSNTAALPNRVDALPDSFVILLAGAPMKLAVDKRDDAAGYEGWAWEEADGTPKLLFVEIWAMPSGAERLYMQAAEGAEPMRAPEGAQACTNGRAVYMQTGKLYIKIVTLGFTEEEDALEMLVSRLAYKTAQAR